ncbi:hypothetical protein EQV77_04005 [Halobacillus fulvus]|nr:hypothetical protein EQV77_04005 [Halobacillus fulvus]
MSWKAVEMQVALPRIQDAGKLQEQIAQRNPTLQHFVSQKQLQADRKKRQSVQKHKKTEDAGIGHSYQSSSSQHQKKDVPAHPHLGKKIDYSG